MPLTGLPGGLEVGGDMKHTGTKTGLNGATPVVQAGAIAAPTAPGAAYSQAEAQSAVAAINAIRTALQNIGITA